MKGILKYFDYAFKLAMVIICVVFLILFYNFTKMKYIKVMIIPTAGSQYEIGIDNIEADSKYLHRK